MLSLLIFRAVGPTVERPFHYWERQEATKVNLRNAVNDLNRKDHLISFRVTSLSGLEYISGNI